MKVYFVRHGQTNYNLQHLCNGDPTKEVHLTELGKKEAKIVAGKLREVPLELIIISEFPRTKETAEIIKEGHYVQIAIDNRINDRKTGFESRPSKEFYEAIHRSENPSYAKFNDGESFYEEKLRVFSFIEYLKQLKEKSILIVSHKEILQIVTGYFNNLSDEKMLSTKVNNCQILEFNL